MASSSDGFPWLLVGRYALLSALCALIPLPLVDSGVEAYLRRRLVRRMAERRGVTLSDEDIKVLADKPSGGCVGCATAIVLWPVKKVLKTLFLLWEVKGIADTFSEVIYRSILLGEAFDEGWLPGDAARVRGAIDRSLAKVDVRLVERAFRVVFRDHRDAVNAVIGEAIALVRQRGRGHAAEAFGDAADQGVSGADDLTAAMKAALDTLGLVPELLERFRTEMAAAPVDGALPVDVAAPVAEVAEPAAVPEPREPG